MRTAVAIVAAGALIALAGTIESAATSVVNSAKSDFPSQTSAVKTSVDALQSAVKALPSSPSATQVAGIATDAAGLLPARSPLSGGWFLPRAARTEGPSDVSVHAHAPPRAVGAASRSRVEGTQSPPALVTCLALVVLVHQRDVIAAHQISGMQVKQRVVIGIGVLTIRVHRCSPPSGTSRPGPAPVPATRNQLVAAAPGEPVPGRGGSPTSSTNARAPRCAPKTPTSPHTTPSCAAGAANKRAIGVGRLARA